jgi:hypothetical protein
MAKVAALLLVLMAGAAPLRAERIELDLHEKMSIAPLVVIGQVEADSQRMADIRVLEVLKGSYPGARLQVAYRLINFERPYGQEKIEFSEAEQVLLFLVPFEDSRGRVSRHDRFILFKGPDGKVPLPVEGRQVWIDAAHRLASLVPLTDSEALFDALRALVADENPLLVEVGLRQARKHKLADERMVYTLLDLVRRPDSRYQAEALDLAADLLHKPSAGALALRDHLRDVASTIAGESREVPLRRAAVRLLASDGTPASRARLRSISEIDPSQDVRYEAAVAVYRLRNAADLQPVVPAATAADLPGPP